MDLLVICETYKQFREYLGKYDLEFDNVNFSSFSSCPKSPPLGRDLNYFKKRLDEGFTPIKTGTWWKRSDVLQIECILLEYGIEAKEDYV